MFTAIEAVTRRDEEGKSTVPAQMSGHNRRCLPHCFWRPRRDSIKTATIKKEGERSYLELKVQNVFRV